MGTYRMCVCFTRRFKMTEAEPPADVKEAFKKYSEGSGNMTADQLRKFLVEVQRDRDVSVSDAGMIVEEVLRKRHQNYVVKNKRNTLTLDDFHHYLFSADLNPPIGDKVHQDMSAPLSHYFVYTGHNSYLTGNQINSDCSVQPIINALKRGVRVVELDIWPNTEDSVHVKHGWTLTTPVELIECFKSIKQHAFYASHYPVIITLEDHLTPDLQAKVAQMITETFEDMLLCPDSECLKEFPSPEELKNRIIISTKPPKNYSKAKSMKQTGENSPMVPRSNGISSSHKGVEGKVTRSIPCRCLSCLFTHKKKKKKKTGHKLLKGKDSDEDEWGKEPSDRTNDPEDDDTSDSDSREHNQDDEDNVDCNQESRIPSACTYKSLIAIHAGKPKGGLKEALKTELDKVRRLSLSEQSLQKAALAHGTDVVRFTQRNFLRVYPKGTRFDSSNYNPLNGWMHGAQMVAFNMQGNGKHLWLMHGMFRSNGGCGFVKKPDFLMKMDQDKQVFDPTANLPVKTTLKVKVYMGDGWYFDFKHTHFDLCSPPDFYTRVGIAGVPADKVMMETKTKEDNWTPTWDKEYTFPLTVPELALLRVEVHEHDISEKDGFAGQTCLPVWELRQGIRAVPLFNRKGEKYNSVKLLMRFEFV